MSKPPEDPGMPLRVALGTYSLLAPLTGIGQYVLHVARGLQLRADIDLTCFYGPYFSREVRSAPPPLADRGRRWMRTWIPNSYAIRRRLEQWRFDAGQRKHRFDVYHEPNFLAQRFDGPTVITVHDLSWIRFPETHPPERVRAMNTFFGASLQDAAVVLTDSEFVRGELLDVFGADPGRIVPIPLGVDPLFRPCPMEETRAVLEPLGLRHRAYFLSVGTLEPRKNLQSTITAYAALPPALRQEYPLVLAGMKGWRTGPMEQLLAPLVDNGQVKVLGYLAREDLAVITAGALTMVYPSLYEGFGLPPLEAMACGVPPIISTAGSLLEVVGDAGLVVEPHDVDALSAAMSRMAEDPGLRARLSGLGRGRAANFTWERCVDRTAAAYRRAAASSR